MKTALWWIRRDLRLSDNQALNAALNNASQVIPTFILDPALLESANTGSNRTAFLFAGLRQLDQDLNKISSRLVIRSGNPLQVLPKLFRECSAEIIYAEADFSPYARRRDSELASILPLELLSGPSLRHPSAVLKSDGTPYTVFTPFMRAWKALPLPDNHDLLPSTASIITPQEVISESLPLHPTLPDSIPFLPGEVEAQQRLLGFTNGENAPIYEYADQRNRMDLNGTAQISPYLRFGMSSARQAVVTANEALRQATDETSRKSAETWLNELIWREFYISILYHFPSVLTNSFRADLQSIPWINNLDDYDAWSQGETGFPAVDAAMRQLLHTGWMHNRARMIVASFLVKDLLIDWRWGERWFMQHLIDGDPAANNGGWQWTAGTGTDAAPYFRIFNPILQSQNFDPNGVYIRRWVPILERVPDKYIHTPWKMPIQLQYQVGCLIGSDYPSPIIDHSFARRRTLEAYNKTRNKAG